MNKKLILIIILVLLLVAGASFGAVKIAKNNDSVAPQDTEQAQESQEEQEAEPYLPPGVIEYNGVRYSRNHDIETTLLLGVETGAEAAELGNHGAERYNLRHGAQCGLGGCEPGYGSYGAVYAGRGGAAE